MAIRACEQCGAALAITARRHARHCSATCRQRAARRRRAEVPAELVALPRWVTHNARKVPLTPGRRPASVTDPATWSEYRAVRQLPRRGFVLGGGIVCVDLDHCVRPDGSLTPWAAALLAQCPPTWVEVSPSGTGLHVWGRGDVPRGRCIRDGRSIEVYGGGRYITVTGRRWGSSPATLADLGPVLAGLLGI
jgi:primase-polymerase (primpol)-like protein